MNWQKTQSKCCSSWRRRNDDSKQWSPQQFLPLKNIESPEWVTWIHWMSYCYFSLVPIKLIFPSGLKHYFVSRQALSCSKKVFLHDKNSIMGILAMWMMENVRYLSGLLFLAELSPCRKCHGIYRPRERSRSREVCLLFSSLLSTVIWVKNCH